MLSHVNTFVSHLLHPALLTTCCALCFAVGCKNKDNQSQVLTPPTNLTPTTEPTPPTTEPVQNPTVNPNPTPSQPPPATTANTSPAAITNKPNTPPAAGSPTPSPAANDANKGKNVSGEGFATWMQAAKTYEINKPATVTVVLTAKDPYKCNEKYPHRFVLNPPPNGVTYPQDTVRGMQVTPKRSTLSVPFTATSEGSATISGTLFFSVCTDERCLMEKRPLSITINAK